MAGENLVKPKGFKAKIQNFWYHYKFHTLVFLVVFVTLFVSVAQCAAKTDYDYKIIVATRSMTLSTPQLEAITTELKQYGEDLNGNGSVDILLIDCTMDNSQSDYQTALGKQQRLQTLLMADAETMLFLVDESCLKWINNLNKQTQFLDDLGLPNNEGKGFLVGNTHIIQTPKAEVNSEANLRWPVDLSICCRRIKGTTFEKQSGAIESRKEALEFIARVVNKNTK
jgi:hypothetical protein